MTNGSPTTVTFTLEKETKGAVRYQETDASGSPLKIGEGAKVGTLYVRKDALNGSIPAKLKVTLEAA